MNLSYNACTFYLKDRYSRESDNKRVDLTSNLIVKDDIEISDKEMNFFKAIEFFCENQSNLYLGHTPSIEGMESSNTFSPKSFSRNYLTQHKGKTEEYDYCIFKVRSGSYGYEANIVDTITGEVTHTKTKTEVEEKEFTIFFVVPKAAPTQKITKGIVFFQNFGQFGVKGLTTRYLKSYFAKLFNLTFEISTLVTSMELEEIIKKAKKVTLIVNHMSKDPSDSIITAGGREERTFLQPKFSTSFVHKMKKVINKESNMLEITDNLYEDMKIEADFGNNVRYISINQIQTLGIIRPIPKDIQLIREQPDIPMLIEFYIKELKEYLPKLTF